MPQHLIDGLTIFGSGQAIGYLILGALIGLVVGVIPGLSGAVVLSIILAFIYHLDLTAALCLFLGSHAGSYYSASVTSILLNTPAHPEAFAVTLDGFPMASRGEAGRALGISAVSTCIGGIVGCAVLVGFIQIMDQLPNLFHPPEYIALISVAMLLVGSLGTDSVAKAVASSGLGFLVSAVGASVITGAHRFTFGLVGLQGGVSLVSVALGLFAVPQMVMIFGTASTITRQDLTGREVDTGTHGIELAPGSGRQVKQGVVEGLHHWVVLIQSGIVGALAGIIPGMGGFAANFLSYGVARETSGRERRELFGTGIPEGIIAPEGASLAKEAGSMIPILGLGIPGGVGGALFLGALGIKGIQVGHGFTTTYPVLPYEIVWILVLAGLIGTTAGVFIGPVLARITRVPGPLIVPFVLALAVIGPFLADVTFFDVKEVFVFGLVGLVLLRLRYSLACFMLGIVLGPTFETNVYLAHSIYPGLQMFSRRPVADLLFAIGILIVIAKAREIHRQARDRVPTKDNGAYPVLSLIASAALLAVSASVVLVSALSFDFTTAVFPVISASVVILAMLYQLPADVVKLLRYERLKHQQHRAPEVVGAAVDEGVRLAAGALRGSGSVQREQWSAETSLEAGAPSWSDQASGRSYEWEGADGVRPVAIQERSWARNGQYRREVVALCWLGGLILLSYLIGFVWAVPIFMGGYSMSCTSRVFARRTGRAVFAAGSAALMWAVTYGALNVLHLSLTPVIHV